MSYFSREDEQSRIHYLEIQLGLARREINNLRQQLKTLSFIHKKECNKIKEELGNWRCVGCRNNQESEVEGAVGNAIAAVPVKYIGTINTDFPEKRATPRQPVICSDLIAKLTLNNEVFTNPNHALEGLQEFSHIWILFHFHKNNSIHIRAKVSPPRLNGARTGVLATRSPHRPNPIGLSLVKINKIVGNNIYFSGVDMIDGTPVVDIKPYIPHYDNPVMINLLEPNCTIESSNSPSLPPEDLQLDNNLDLDVRVMDGEENNMRDLVLGATSSEHLNLGATLEEFYTRFGEREAPDGEEEESSISTQTIDLTHVLTPENHIRVPSWINNSPVNTLCVIFKERALFQLSQLGNESEKKKNTIANILKEDPRSTYLRERWGSHCYVFRINELYISCRFNDVMHTVTVYRVFQNTDTEDNN